VSQCSGSAGVLFQELSELGNGFFIHPFLPVASENVVIAQVSRTPFPPAVNWRAKQCRPMPRRVLRPRSEGPRPASHARYPLQTAP
jgi:hypothetical protein